MLKIKVNIDDWDTDEAIELILPCDIKNAVDTSHCLFIDAVENGLIDYCDDIEDLNNALDSINSECPSMTAEILSAILQACDYRDISDKDFVHKICNNDFMFEEITGVIEKSKEEKCARFLATEMMIPFARNITDEILEEMSAKPNRVSWDVVWCYYELMGFTTITVNDRLYAFHWGDAYEK